MSRRIVRPSREVLVRCGIALALIVFAVAMRIMPHPANVAPVAAIALFGGAVLPRAWALALPLTAMIVSDLLIGLHSTVLFTWGSFAMIAFGAHYGLRRITPLRVMGASLSASLLFYLVSNFGVWLEGRMYALTWEGFVQCYVNALPFLRATITGDILFSAAIFGIYAFTCRLALHRRVVPVS